MKDGTAGLRRALIALLVAIPVLLVVDVFLHREDGTAGARVPGTSCPAETLLVLEAQAVPSAQQVPCVSDELGAWVVRSTQIQNGSSSITYGTGEVNGAQWTIDLLPACSVPADATSTSWKQQPIFQRRDQQGGRTQRRQWIEVPGGCVVSRFDMPAQATDVLAERVDEALELPTRDQVATIVDDDTDGVLTLDPPSS